MLLNLLPDVLSSSAEDFESSDDVVEAVGGFLQECDASKGEKEIEYVRKSSEFMECERYLTPFISIVLETFVKACMAF